MMAHGDKPDRARAARPRRGPDPQVEARVRELVKQHGLSRAQASQVARGRADVNTLLRRMAMEVEVESLMRRQELSRALATQVALGQADLEQVLLKRRMAAHLEAHRSRSLIDDSAASEARVQLGLHGFRVVEGLLTGVTRFEFDLQPRRGDAETVHKLQLKWACASDDAKKVRRAHRYDPERKAAPAEPIWKPQDRYNCSNRRLFNYLDAEAAITVTTLEGDQFKGQITWVGRYEFGLLVKGNVEVVIFRHALAEVRV